MAYAVSLINTQQSRYTVGVTTNVITVLIEFE